MALRKTFVAIKKKMEKKRKEKESYTICQELNMKNMCALFKQHSSHMHVLFIHVPLNLRKLTIRVVLRFLISILLYCIGYIA